MKDQQHAGFTVGVRPMYTSDPNNHVKWVGGVWIGDGPTLDKTAPQETKDDALHSAKVLAENQPKIEEK